MPRVMQDPCNMKLSRCGTAARVPRRALLQQQLAGAIVHEHVHSAVQEPPCMHMRAQRVTDHGVALVHHFEYFLQHSSTRGREQGDRLGGALLSIPTHLSLNFVVEDLYFLFSAFQNCLLVHQSTAIINCAI